MKITKSQLRQIIKEEYYKPTHALSPAQQAEMHACLNKKNKEGQEATAQDKEICADEVRERLKETGVSEELTTESLKQMIKEELGRSGYLGNGYKWCPSGTKCVPQQTKTKWWSK